MLDYKEEYSEQQMGKSGEKVELTIPTQMVYNFIVDDDDLVFLIWF